MFRAEQMAQPDRRDHAGDRGGRGRRRTLVNGSDLELRDAVLVDVTGPEQRRETYLGTIAPGGVGRARPPAGPTAVPAQVEGHDGPDPAPLLAQLRKSWENRPENRASSGSSPGSRGRLAGQTLEPALDRHRGLTAVVVAPPLRHPPSARRALASTISWPAETARAGPLGRRPRAAVRDRSTRKRGWRP